MGGWRFLNRFPGPTAHPREHLWERSLEYLRLRCERLREAGGRSPEYLRLRLRWGRLPGGGGRGWLESLGLRLRCERLGAAGRRSRANLQTGCARMGLQLGNGGALPMQRIGDGQTRSTGLGRLMQVPGPAITAAGNDGNRDKAGLSAHQVDVETFARAFLVDGGQHDLARPQGHGLPDPRDDIQPGMLAAVVDESLPAAAGSALGFDGQHHALG